MCIDNDDLKILLNQAKLKMKDENQEKDMINRLNKDLNFINGIFNVQVSSIEPLYNPVNFPSMTREDVPGKTLDNSVIMKLSGSGEYGYIVVPAVPAATEKFEYKK